MSQIKSFIRMIGYKIARLGVFLTIKRRLKGDQKNQVNVWFRPSEMRLKGKRAVFIEVVCPHGLYYILADSHMNYPLLEDKDKIIKILKYRADSTKILHLIKKQGVFYLNGEKIVCKELVV